MHPTVARPSRLSRFALLPAFALLAWGGLSAAGVQLTPESTAATTGNVTVSAQVLPEISVSGTCASGGSISGATLTPSTAGTQAIGNCVLTQATTNGSTTLARVESSRSTAGTGIFCKTTIAPATTACAGTAAQNFTQVTAGAGSLADGDFGIKVAAAGTCIAGANTWALNTYHPLRDATTAPGAGDSVCSTLASTATSSTTLNFDADPLATQEAGTYQTQAIFTVADV